MVRFILPMVLIVTAAFMGNEVWSLYMNDPWTRDARVRAEISQIAPKVSGEIVAIHVMDNDYVSKGSPLFDIEETDYVNHLNEIEAELAQAKATLKQAKNNYERNRSLLPKKLVSEKQVLNEKLEVEAQQSTVAKVEADLAQAKLNLTRTKVLAPKDGFVTNLKQRVGNYINVGETFVALVEADSYYVLGYFNEAKVKHIKEGQKVMIYPYTSSDEVVGEIDSIGRAIVDQSSDQSGLIPNVQPTIPWVRLGQRVPVRISISSDVVEEVRLIAGTTVTVRVQP
ncbi:MULTISPECIES: HlyD family secretion protein [Vibrio]|uniref:efflux RND transporter periplasmic adaptor subunit n=1 Tax=Vibrio TaxID=662 RepID=UPI001F06961D|nr:MULTISPECIES: HlyD family secretion protein [Vibrio]